MRQVAIVGAGIIGLCSAESLSRRGFRVTVYDRDLNSDGCSYGNGGIIVPSHFVPLASPETLRLGFKMLTRSDSPFGFVRPWNLNTLSWLMRFALSATHRNVERGSALLSAMNLESRRLYEELLTRAGIDAGYQRKGLLMLCHREGTLEAEASLIPAAERLGLHARRLSRSEVETLEPGIQMNIAGGVYFEDDAHLTPPAFMDGLRLYLQSKGVEFVTRDVADLGELHADEIVVAAGAWTRDLCRVPVLSGRGYGFTVTNPPSRPSIPSILVEARVAVTPMLDGVRFVGTMELGSPERGVNPRRISGMKRSISEYYPAFSDLDRVPVWSGLRPCTPDGLPIIGRRGNRTIATGHAMMGMSLGPVTGEIVASLVCGEKTGFDLGPLSPDRF